YTSLAFQTASLKSLEGIPNCTQGRLMLQISRKDGEAAERLIRAVQQRNSAVEVEKSPAPAWREVAWPASDSPVATPPIPAPQPPGHVGRKLRSLFNSVYTIFFSRAKSADAATTENKGA